MSCTLCDQPLPVTPVTTEGVDGEFCCRGCLTVARTLGDAADAEAMATEPADPDPVPDDAAHAFLSVEGMHCVTCGAFLERRARSSEGVHGADASYAAGLVSVHYDADRTDPDGLAGTLSVGGYDASPVEPGSVPDEEPADDGYDGRLLVGSFMGMMAMLWYVLFLYPFYLDFPDRFQLFDVTGPVGAYLLANLWVFATVVLGYTGGPILRGALAAVRARRPNMDLLVAIAACTAYLYSVAVVLLGGHEVYFDVTIAVVLAVTVGNRYESRVTRSATDRLRELVDERTATATLKTPDGPEEVPREAVDPGDELLVSAGERVPVDGTVREGTASLDRALVTGESRPVRVEPGETVAGGTRVVDGTLVVEAGEESTVDRLLAQLWSVQSARPETAKLADRLASWFVPVVGALALLTVAAHLEVGATPTAALLVGVSVLVVSCPCALGLATPLALASGVRTAMERGLVVTAPATFERGPDVDVVALDKTGTLTTGEMAVVATHGDERAPRLAAAVEQYVDHPVADAATDRWDAPDAPVTDVETHPGHGASARVGDRRVAVGRRELFAQLSWPVPDEFDSRARGARESGRTPALVGWDGAVRGLLVAADRPRDGWADAVTTLADRADRVVVLTGDGAAAAAEFGAHPGVDDVFADLTPGAKVATVERLAAEGTVAMVGDGSNDAPALAAADIGIAVSDGTALAVDAADAVVTDGDLSTAVAALDVATGTRKRVRENLAWAFCYNAVALPLAALGLVTPALAAVAMAASSVLVVANAARPLDVEASSADRGLRSRRLPRIRRLLGRGWLS
ncbi:MAG: heavy metal translocating P-type ATPase [Haloarculaceae archaeon]